MEILIACLAVFGVFFAVVAALGLLRMPDLPTRLHAATKSGTLSAALLLTAVAISGPDASVVVRAVATVVFLFLTAPVAAQVIGHAAYHSGQIQLWRLTRFDELRTELQTHEAGDDERASPGEDRDEP